MFTLDDHDMAKVIHGILFLCTSLESQAPKVIPTVHAEPNLM
jgi:hypothetical protein